MSYEVHYTLPFKRLDGVECRFDILEKDYTGYPVTLIGSGRSPVVHSWDGSDVLDPIQGSKVVVQFVYERSGVSISDLLTTDETFFRGDLYVNNELQFTGYMVIDDFSEPYLYAPTNTTLTFTDGLALLDNVTLLDAGYNVRSGRKTISEIIENILLLTNLDLSITNYYNLFPYKVDYYVDRDDVPGIDAFELQYINTNSFLSGDDGFEDCKEVLTRILKDNKSVLRQVKGKWVIVRVPEYKRFAGAIPGSVNVLTPMNLTADWVVVPLSVIGTFTITGQAALLPYFSGVDTFTISASTDSDFNRTYTILSASASAGDLLIVVPTFGGAPSSATITADFLTSRMKTVAPDLNTLNVGTDLIPVDRSQLKQYTSPVKKITDTYNYRIPQLLTNSNLTRLGDLIGSSVDGDNTLTDYELSDWTNQNDETGFIRIITNTATGKEVDRYMVLPFSSNDPIANDADGVVSVQVEVNEKDRFKLTYQYRANSDSSDALLSRVGIHLTSSDGSLKRTLSFLNNSNASTNKLYWGSTIQTGSNFSSNLPAITRIGSEDHTDWASFDLLNFDYNEIGMPPFPFDGTLRIQVYGFNNVSGSIPDKDCYIKDFQFEYQLFINDSIRIEGQEHKVTNDVTNKKDIADQIFIDSSPKFNIAGGIFCWDGTRIALADVFTKESGGTDKYLHGEVNTIDELLLKSNWRTVFEGEFSGYCSPLDSVTIDNLDGLFLPYKLSIDYRQNRCSASFYEVSKATDSSFTDMEYNFRYLYKVERP